MVLVCGCVVIQLIDSVCGLQCVEWMFHPKNSKRKNISVGVSWCCLYIQLRNTHIVFGLFSLSLTHTILMEAALRSTCFLWWIFRKRIFHPIFVCDSVRRDGSRLGLTLIWVDIVSNPKIYAVGCGEQFLLHRSHQIPSCKHTVHNALATMQWKISIFPFFHRKYRPRTLHTLRTARRS